MITVGDTVVGYRGDSSPKMLEDDNGEMVWVVVRCDVDDDAGCCITSA